jgi:hypothetical protein
LEYRNKNYDIGCTLSNDTIKLDYTKILYLHFDSTFQILRLSKPSGVILVPKEYKFAFYPNPILNEAFFEFENSKADNIKLILIDNFGTVINLLNWEQSFVNDNTIKLDLRNISSGIYYLRVLMNNNPEQTIKLIKE